MNSVSQSGWRNVLVIDDDAAFAQQLVEALARLGVTAQVETSFTEMERCLARQIDKYDVVLLDLGIPERRDDPADLPILSKGIKALKWLNAWDASLSVIAYTFRQLKDRQRTEINDVGILALLELGTISDTGKRVEDLLARVRQKDEECRKIASMLHERSWAHALLDTWGVGISVVEWGAGTDEGAPLHGRILYQDEHHRQITKGRQPIRYGTCFKEWHDYLLRCGNCPVSRTCESGVPNDVVLADRIGKEIFYAFVRCIALATTPEAGKKFFAAMEAVVPLSRHDPLIEGMSLRSHLRLLCAAICCASGAKQCVVFQGLDLEQDNPRLVPISGLRREGTLDVTNCEMRVHDDYRCDKAWQDGECAVRNVHDKTPDRAAAKLRFVPPEGCNVIYVPLSTESAQGAGDSSPFGLLRLDVPPEHCEAEKPYFAGRLEEDDVLVRELAAVLKEKGTNRWEQLDVRGYLQKQIKSIADKCGFANVRLYRTSHSGAWLWGCLHEGIFKGDFEEAYFLTREDKASYSAVLDREPKIYTTPCDNSRLCPSLPPACNRIEFPVFADDEKNSLVCKLVADNGSQGVTKNQLTLLKGAMESFISRLLDAFRRAPAARLPSERTALIHWSELQAKVALSQDPEEAVAILLESLANQTGATSAYVRIERNGNLELHKRAQIGKMPGTVRPCVSLGEAYSFSARACRSGTRSIWNHAQEIHEYRETTERWLKDAELRKIHNLQRSVGIFPIMGAGEYVGSMAIHSERDPEFFTEEVIRAVDEVASDIGRIVRHQRLLEAAQSTEKLKAQTWKMISYQVAHEILNPASAQAKFLVDLKSRLVEMNAADLDVDLVNSALTAQRRIARIASEIHEIGVHFVPSYNRIRLKSFVSELWKTVSNALKEATGVSFRILGSDVLEASADRQFLDSALDALVSNAVLHGATKSDNRVVRCEIAGPIEAHHWPMVDMPASYVSVTIHDSGPGVPPDVEAWLFEPFNPKATGSGLGLAIAKRKVEAMNGRIRYLRGGDLGGATFVVALQHYSNEHT